MLNNATATKSAQMRMNTMSDEVQMHTIQYDELFENLTELVHAADLKKESPFAGDAKYEAFFEKVSRSLHRSHPKHVVIIREPGVGERAVLIELARRGLAGIPHFLSTKQILFVNIQRINANQMEQTFNTIIHRIENTDESILCLEGLGRLLRNTERHLARINFRSILEAMRSRSLIIISPREYEDFIAGDQELQEHFSSVFLPEPDITTARKIIERFAQGLEVQYDIHITPEALDRAVILSDCYVLHERLPAKALKVLHSICDDVHYDRSQKNLPRTKITESDVFEKIAQISGVPITTLAGIGEGINYRKSLGNIVVGQEHAVQEVATELGLIKAGMVDTGKPASVMIFVGQTGTGKTELAKALAHIYSSSKKLKTFTLGNFSEPHSVSGIIGVPPGYVGHEQGGRLVNELNADPYGVFLLDEADKAHPDVMQPFLNLFDEGWICDQKGNIAYAHRAIFILTTNIGQRQIAEMCRSGKSMEEMTSAMKDSLSRIRHSKSNRPVFTPEFLSRIKRFVIFRSLDQVAMEGISQKLIREMQEDWFVRRQKRLLIPVSLVHAIGLRAFEIDDKSQGREGGRIVRKLLANTIESKIQMAISQQPQEYQRCKEVELEYDEEAKVLSQMSITIRFL